MGSKNKVTRQAEAPPKRCASCGHLEVEHANSGTRPCLATVGELLVRDFCSCDTFREKAAQAA